MEWRYTLCSSKCKCQLQTVSKMSNSVSDWLTGQGRGFQGFRGVFGGGSVGRNALDLHPHRAASSSYRHRHIVIVSLPFDKFVLSAPQSRIVYYINLCAMRPSRSPRCPFFPSAPHMGNLIQMSFHTLRGRAQGSRFHWGKNIIKFKHF